MFVFFSVRIGISKHWLRSADSINIKENIYRSPGFQIADLQFTDHIIIV